MSEKHTPVLTFAAFRAANVNLEVHIAHRLGMRVVTLGDLMAELREVA